MVDILIPTYNCAKYLPHAINSVLDQTYQDFNIIVIDDGSVDNTNWIIRNFIEKHPNKIKYFYQPHAGPAIARNVGLKKAQDKYIAFLDADDIWLPNKLAIQVEYLENRHDVALVYGDLGIFDERGIIERNYYKSKKIPRPSGYIFKDLIMRCLISTITVMTRREVFDKVGGFDEATLLGEDYDLWLRIAKSYKIGYINEVLAMYRQHQSSLMYRSIEANKDFLWENRIVEKILSIYPKERKNITGLQLAKRFSRTYFELGYTYFKQGTQRKAGEYFKKCIRLYPFRLNYFIFYLTSWLNPKIIKWISKTYKIIIKSA